MQLFGVLIVFFLSSAATSGVPDPIKKDEFCAHNYLNSKEALDLITVSPSLNYPRVLVNTISSHHDTAVRAILDTWGSQCDKLVFASNLTDVSRVRNETYGKEYDWFYKSDDDAYVIMDNLKAYLRTPMFMTRMFSHPITFGHRFKLPETTSSGLIRHDGKLLKEFQTKYKNWIYNSGRPGYAMNRMYLKDLIDSVQERTCLSDYTIADDAAISFCMAWNDAFPYDTRDLDRKERFHFDQPSGVYHTSPPKKDTWVYKYHDGIGGYINGNDCCSSSSIAFHYTKPKTIYYIAQQLLFCRSGEVTIKAFTTRYEMNLPDTIMT